ncbi:MAG: ATP-binding protein [Dehalococcoidia bacterium]|nr:ATP-binding protein [Dehalococcoidia bacterium]
MAVGRYVVIEGQTSRFFAMISDIKLGAIDQRLTITPPDTGDPFIAEVIAGTGTYGILQVVPLLTIGGDAASMLAGPHPVKTVPAHFSGVYEASSADVELVFGKEDERHFYVGTPLDMETRVCLNTREFVKRSNGVFGKSGTGKTFFTRLLLIGIVQKRDAVNLIFDMHSEYGWAGTSENARSVKGLKQLFPAQVALFTLDEQSARRRKASTDYVVEIGYDEIEPEDIALLKDTLNLTEHAAEAVYQFQREFGEKKWLEGFFSLGEGEDTDEVLKRLNVHESSYRNLRRGLERLKRLPFLVPHAADNSVKRILAYLDSGKNVVLEFGRYTDITVYVLVANILTRRIYDQYRERTERVQGEGGEKPQPLVITIEEAHKFLNREVASQTIFGTIAREMRKYGVTLLVIDQRPSSIDDEVMSQLGTKATYLLDNENDVDSVLMGVSGKTQLKTVLSKLEATQQALIFGHALPMPVVVRTRDYGSAESYRTLGFMDAVGLRRKLEEEIRDLS